MPYYCPMFTEWLLAQRESSGEVGLAGRLAWAEMNNGMVARKDHPLFFWKEHFEHRGKPDLFRVFLIAYLEYKQSSPEA
jgi:hypothetical protein